jgi:hypothetical protein
MPNGKILAQELHNSNRFRESLFGKNDKYADLRAVTITENHKDNFKLINEDSCLSKE